jgi:hypothetical protein
MKVNEIYEDIDNTNNHCDDCLHLLDLSNVDNNWLVVCERCWKRSSPQIEI